MPVKSAQLFTKHVLVYQLYRSIPEAFCEITALPQDKPDRLQNFLLLWSVGRLQRVTFCV